MRKSKLNNPKNDEVDVVKENDDIGDINIVPDPAN